MAIPFSQIPFPSSTITSPKSTHPNTPLLTTPKHTTFFPKFASSPRKFTNIPKATDDENTTADEKTSEESSQSSEMTELGMEIKKAMNERSEKESGFFSGVVEEIREIEWPVFNKVLGTTGVVLGVIAGSSVVLLTVNAVLAEISDRVFAGRGVQDFFG